MATIKIRVNGEIATNLTPEVKLVCRNERYTAEFEFDESWANSNAKTALFIYNGECIKVPFGRDTDGDVCKIPALFNTELLHIGVKSNDVDGLHTSTPARVGCLFSADDLESTEIPEPTVEEYDKILALLNEYVNSVPEWAKQPEKPVYNYAEILGTPQITYNKATEKIVIEELETSEFSEIATIGLVSGNAITVTSDISEQIKVGDTIYINGEELTVAYFVDNHPSLPTPNTYIGVSVLPEHVKVGDKVFIELETEKPLVSQINDIEIKDAFAREEIKKSVKTVFDGEYNPETNKAATVETVIRKVAEIVAGAPQDFDTLKELSDWLTSHEGTAAEMNSAIAKNAENIEKAKAETDEKLAEKVGFTDYPTANIAGAVKVTKNNSGMQVSSGQLQLSPASPIAIFLRPQTGVNYNERAPITLGNLNIAVIATLTDDKKILMTDDEKAKACETLGVTELIEKLKTDNNLV